MLHRLVLRAMWQHSKKSLASSALWRARTRLKSSGNTARSDGLIDYTTLVSLGEIIKASWTVFCDVFWDVRAVENIMSRLSTLRGPIAHCKVLAEDEIVRLGLSLRDLFCPSGVKRGVQRQ